MAIEIVDFPMNSMVIFHSYVELPEGISVSDQVTEIKMPPGDYSSPPIDQQLLHKIWRIRLEQRIFWVGQAGCRTGGHHWFYILPSG